MSGVGDSRRGAAPLFFGTHAGAHRFVNTQLDSYAYPVTIAHDATQPGSGNPIFFENLKLDCNSCPAGTTSLQVTAPSNGLRISNFEIRGDPSGIGNGIVLSGAVRNVGFVNGRVWRPESAGASNIGFAVTNPSASHVFLTNVWISGWSTGLSDVVSTANLDSYQQMSFSSNTTDYRFGRNWQAISGVNSTGAAISRVFDLYLGNVIHGARLFDNDLLFQTKSPNLGIIHFQDSAWADKYQISMVNGATLQNENSPGGAAPGLAACYTDSTIHQPKCSFNNGTFFPTPQTGNSSGAHSDSGFYQTAAATGCTTPASMGATCTTVVTWPVGFADSNYKIFCQGSGGTANSPVMGSVTSRSPATAAVQTVALTAAGAAYTLVECLGVHD
jgi:hypothetical protein